MKKLVAHGAKLQCTQGTAPATLTVLPNGLAGPDVPVATVADSVPMKNVGSFGLCRSLANPQVSAATSAAQGVLTPQPCVPVIPQPWSPGAAGVKVGTACALSADSTCACQWAGTITVTDPAVAGLEGS